MVTLQSVIEQIKNSNEWEDWVCFPENLTKILNITEEEKIFLIEQGLPDFVAPHLYFGDFDGLYLPKLKDWTWNEKKISFADQVANLYVFGADPDSNPICLDKNGKVIIVLEDSTIQFMNSSILIMVQALIYYSEMVNEIFEKDEDAFINKRFEAFF